MDKAKKKQIKKVLTWVSMALVVALLAAMPLLAKAEIEDDGPVATVHSGTVEKGTIHTTLRGGGNLTAKDAEDVKLPEGVKITEFLVNNGDSVTKGTPLATVDKVSVMTAIVEVRETMDYLREELESARNETVSSTIPATAGGRVKQVYAKAGDSVQDVMLRDGALAVLTLDSRMAVQLKEELPLTTGDAVLVTLSDGTEIEGRVESNLDGTVTITVEDKGYAIGEAVVIRTAEGQQLGTGELYVHNAWKATAFTGTISSVYAREEAEVYAGSTLFTLTDTAFTAQLEHLSNQHREYEALMQELFRMYEEGAVLAPCDGLISGVDKDSAFLLCGEAVSWELVPLEADSEEKGWTIQLLKNDSSKKNNKNNKNNKTDKDTGNASDETEPTIPAGSEAIGYPGKVTHIGKGELIVTMSEVGGTVVMDEDGNWDFSQVDLNPKNMLHSGLTLVVEDESVYAVGDIIVVIYSEDAESYCVAIARKAETENEDPLPGQNQTPEGMEGMEGMSGFGGMDLSGLMGSMGGFGGMGGGAATEETEPELFDLEGTVLMTVTPQSTVSLTITLDEQEIARVTPGLTAEVKVEALRGQVFEAVVTEVGITGSNNGGSSKFTATLEMDYAPDMLDGMSATATLPLYTKVDVLTIPVKALVEEGSKTLVCTALDEETGEPAAPVEVTVGMSDGETAEILAGLQLGDTYYYSYYDVLEMDTNAEVSRYSF